ncbi:Hypothetical predicted protein, partial [Paramuricea clavata]
SDACLTVRTATNDELLRHGSGRFHAMLVQAYKNKPWNYPTMLSRILRLQVSRNGFGKLTKWYNFIGDYRSHRNVNPNENECLAGGKTKIYNIIETCQNNPEDVSISIIFVGDISFARCVRKYVDHGCNNYNDTMIKVAGIIREADIAVGNLESPFVTKMMLKDRFNGRKKIFLHADHRSAAALRDIKSTVISDTWKDPIFSRKHARVTSTHILKELHIITLPNNTTHATLAPKFAGFDIMSLANNHLNDYGEKPVNFTRNILSNAGIDTIGSNFGSYDSPQRSLIQTKEGIKVGFLGYCYIQSCFSVRKKYKAGPAIYSDHIAKRDVLQLKVTRLQTNIIVYMHWGAEYKLHPNRRQLSIAKYLHSLGVSAVIGAHPHVLQPHSRSTNHLTAYSVGNFLFPRINDCLTQTSASESEIFSSSIYVPRCLIICPQDKLLLDYKNISWNDPTKLSRILRLQITRNGVIGAKYLPVTIKFDHKTKTLQPTLSNDTQWIDVCSTRDEECLRQTSTSKDKVLP